MPINVIIPDSIEATQRSEASDIVEVISTQDPMNIRYDGTPVDQIQILVTDPIQTTNNQPSTIRIINNEVAEIVNVIESGPMGRTGERGEDGTGVSREPFYAIIVGSQYATTASIGFFANISSSLLPHTASGELTQYTIGSLANPWRGLYVATESIYFIQNGESIVNLRGGRDRVLVGSSFVSTSSIGFDTTPVIIRNSSTSIKMQVTGSVDVIGDGQTKPFRVRSGSLEVIQVSTDGIFEIGEFSYTPNSRTGGILISGSNIFVGL